MVGGVLLAASPEERICQETTVPGKTGKEKNAAAATIGLYFLKQRKALFFFLISPKPEFIWNKPSFAYRSSVLEGMSDLSCSLSPAELEAALWAAGCPFWVWTGPQ